MDTVTTHRERDSFHADPEGGRLDAGSVALGATAALLMGTGLLRDRRSWPLVVLGLGVGALGARRMVQPRAQPEEGVKVAKSVTIDRPRSEVYRAWRDLERLPAVLQHVRHVEWTGENRLKWSVELFEGAPPTTWIAIIERERPDELIHWRSEEGSEVHQEGVIRFLDAPGGRGTEVHVSMSYRPGTLPGGRRVAKAVRPVVAREIRKDLRRFKQLLETGELATQDVQPASSSRETNSTGNEVT